LLPTDEPYFNKHRDQQNKLISTLNYCIYYIALTAALEKNCGGPPTPPAAWIHQIHAAGGVSGSTTIVMLSVMLFLLFVWFLTLDLSVGRILPTF
jgi:hypothetical protein